MLSTVNVLIYTIAAITTLFSQTCVSSDLLTLPNEPAVMLVGEDRNCDAVLIQQSSVLTSNKFSQLSWLMISSNFFGNNGKED